jgi:hypothetical protein
MNKTDVLKLYNQSQNTTSLLLLPAKVAGQITNPFNFLELSHFAWKLSRLPPLHSTNGSIFTPE